MELLACEKKLNTLFPRGISLIIVDLAYGYDHPSRHHAGCNVHKFVNGKHPCNCLFRMNHSDPCAFYSSYVAIENDKIYAATSGGWIHRWAGTFDTFCTCTIEIPKKIICNTCYTPLKHCCVYNCIFCFVCDSCGVGHSYVNLWNILK